MRVPALAATAVLVLAGCGSESDASQDVAADPSASPSASESASEEPTGDPSAMPTAEPVPDGEVATTRTVTVVDDGSGVVACFGIVAESAPPQCDGTPLEGWDWTKVKPLREPGASGGRWGDFALQGTFDGETFAVTDVTPAALYEGGLDDPLSTAPTSPCEPPEGGWGVVDEATATPELLDAALTEAAQLPDLAGSWVTPIDPAANPNDGAVLGDPAQVVLNVTVTDDVDGARAALAETYGGAICVAEAAYSQAELQDIATQVQELPGMVNVTAENDTVTVEVLYDDGTLQEWADGAYPEGVVQVVPVLEPVG